MIIQYEKTFQGAHKFYALNANDELVTMQYFYVTKREALQNFKRLLKGGVR